MNTTETAPRKPGGRRRTPGIARKMTEGSHSAENDSGVTAVPGAPAYRVRPLRTGGGGERCGRADRRRRVKPVLSGHRGYLRGKGARLPGRRRVGTGACAGTLKLNRLGDRMDTGGRMGRRRAAWSAGSRMHAGGRVGRRRPHGTQATAAWTRAAAWTQAPAAWDAGPAAHGDAGNSRMGTQGSRMDAGGPPRGGRRRPHGTQATAAWTRAAAWTQAVAWTQAAAWTRGPGGVSLRRGRLAGGWPPNDWRAGPPGGPAAAG